MSSFNEKFQYFQLLSDILKFLNLKYLSKSKFMKFLQYCMYVVNVCSDLNNNKKYDFNYIDKYK